MALSKNILATPSKRLWPIQSSLVGSNRTSRCYQSTISKVFISVRDQCLHFITIKWHQFCSQEHEQKSRIRPSPAQMGRLTDIGSRNIFTEEQVSKGRTHEKNDVLLDFFQITLPPALPPTPQFGQLVKLFSDVKIQDLKVRLELKILYLLYNILHIYILK